MHQRSLISRLQEGEQAAFSEVFAAHRDMVYTVCLGFVPVSEDAEDLVQEVFMEIFRSVKQFQGNSKLSTWIYRICVTKSLELIRKRKRKKRSGILKSILPGEGPQIADSYRMNHPGLRMENNEKAEALYRALDKLPESQRIAFTLTQVDGMSYEETAATMAVTKGSVESLIFRARKNLKKHLGNFYRS